MEWIDTHCHLNEEAFTSDRAEVVATAVAEGVTRMIVIGVNLHSSREAVDLAARFGPVSAVVGIQPNYVHAAGPDDWREIEQLLSAEKVVGIGETGLDRYWDFASIDLQVDYFRRHLALSQERGLPFVVHCREAEADVIRVLREARANGPLNGVMHSFSGDQAAADAALELGLHISFSGMVSFKRNDVLRAVAKTVPSDHLLIETDAPYLAPAPHRGKRNEPAYVRHIGQFLADLRGVPADEFAATTTANARALFRLP